MTEKRKNTVKNSKTVPKKKNAAGGAKKQNPAHKKKHNTGNEKRPSKIYSALLLIISIAGLSLFFFTMFSQMNENTEGSFSCDLYFKNTAASTLQTESRTIKDGDQKTVLESVLTELQKGPKNAELSDSIPKSFSIRKLTLNPTDYMLEINVSEEYVNLSAIDELLCRTALVWTFTELEFVNGVKIVAGENELTQPDGRPLGFMTRENTVLNSELTTVHTDYQTIKLYFSDSSGNGLVMEERTVVVNPSLPIELYVMQELVKGPLTAGLFATLPSDTKIGNVKTDNGTCYVDLNAEVLNKIQAGSSNELLAIYSMVNSLTELSDIQRIQLLFGGIKAELNDGNLDISAPFKRNEDIIMK